MARSIGRRALVVIGKTVGAAQRVEPLLTALLSAGVDYHTFSVSGEPTLAVARAGAALAVAQQCELVISFGGGSVIDTGKAVAALATNSGDPLDYVEIIGRGAALTKPTLSHIAIPTTAGTGAEVTRNAVLGSPEHRVKVSLRSPLMLPCVALVDPSLTADLPPAITASTGLDALTQLIEPFVSVRANPITDAFCRDGIPRVARSLRRACEQGDDAAARADMALASLFGGLALANAGLGAVHGLAGPLGGMFDAPHGALCAALLPHVMAVNVKAVAAVVNRGRDEDRAYQARLQRFDEVARLLTGDAIATAADGVAWVRELCAALRIAPLGSFGVTRDDFPALIEKGASASSMKGNPLPLTPAELQEILERSL